MKILIVGSGGREHAIAASVAKSPRADKIYCAPGNAGIAEYAECVDIGAMEFEKLAEFAKEKEIDLCIVGMDDPLVGGLVDVLEDAGIRTFGPKKNAAILEGSKAFSKDLMKKYDIPTMASLNTIMVDGTGMCGACRVTVGGKTKFVCVDGPEFDAHQVDFDEMLMRLSSYKGIE